MGTALLSAAEKDARRLGARGMAAWGVWLPFWMKASWFKQHGYRKADRQGLAMLARAEDDGRHAALLARDAESDLEVGAVCNEIWNAMGRPRQAIDYDLIVNGGKAVWTDGDPAKQPAMMALLAQNIRATTHAKLAERKEDWAKRIEAKAAAQAEAAKPAESSYARLTYLTRDTGSPRSGNCCLRRRVWGAKLLLSLVHPLTYRGASLWH